MKQQHEVEDHDLGSRSPRSEVRHILTFRHLLKPIVLAVILFFLLVLGSCTAIGVPYGVSKVRMTYCGESENVCTLNGIAEFEVGDKICIAWTDVNRSSSDNLSVFIYRNSERVYDKKVEEEIIESKQECRAIPIETTLPSGLYETEFALNGRLVEGIRWEIKESSYSIENPRMVICNSDVNVCQLEGVSRFSLTDKICTAWTDVDRNLSDSFAFFVYNEKDEELFSYDEPASNSTTQSCRVQQIENSNVPGHYRTEFTPNGRRVEEIMWSVSSSPTLYHMNGEIGCMGHEPIIFFEGDVDTSINEGEFLIKGAGVDQFNYVVEVLGKFDGQEILAGTIRMYDGETYRADNHNQPFRIDLLEGAFQNLELYSVGERILVNNGCEIFTRIYLEEPTVGSITETPISSPTPWACTSFRSKKIQSSNTPGQVTIDTPWQGIINLPSRQEVQVVGSYTGIPEGKYLWVFIYSADAGLHGRYYPQTRDAVRGWQPEPTTGQDGRWLLTVAFGAPNLCYEIIVMVADAEASQAIANQLQRWAAAKDYTGYEINGPLSAEPSDPPGFPDGLVEKASIEVRTK